MQELYMHEGMGVCLRPHGSTTTTYDQSHHTESCTSSLLSWAWSLLQVCPHQSGSLSRLKHALTPLLPTHTHNTNSMYKADQAHLEATTPLTQLPPSQHMRHLWHAILPYPACILPVHMGPPCGPFPPTHPATTEDTAKHPPHKAHVTQCAY